MYRKAASQNIQCEYDNLKKEHVELEEFTRLESQFSNEIQHNSEDAKTVSINIFLCCPLWVKNTVFAAGNQLLTSSNQTGVCYMVPMGPGK